MLLRVGSTLSDAIVFVDEDVVALIIFSMLHILEYRLNSMMITINSNTSVLFFIRNDLTC
jgi:hypothetical protein